MAKQTIEILWSDKAIADLRNIYEYLFTQISEQSAFDYTKRIVSSAEILQTHPLSGSQ